MRPSDLVIGLLVGASLLSFGAGLWLAMPSLYMLGGLTAAMAAVIRVKRE